LGRTLDAILNPDPNNKTEGFVLLMFDLNTNKGRMNYLANAERGDMLKALEELVDNMKKDMPR
jgi:hypothetical protein